MTESPEGLQAPSIKSVARVIDPDAWGLGLGQYAETNEIDSLEQAKHIQHAARYVSMRKAREIVSMFQPEVAPSGELDPKPYVFPVNRQSGHDDGRYSLAEYHADVWPAGQKGPVRRFADFKPRDGYAQDLDDYGVLEQLEEGQARLADHPAELAAFERKHLEEQAHVRPDYRPRRGTVLLDVKGRAWIVGNHLLRRLKFHEDGRRQAVRGATLHELHANVGPLKVVATPQGPIYKTITIPKP